MSEGAAIVGVAVSETWLAGPNTLDACSRSSRARPRFHGRQESAELTGSPMCKPATSAARGSSGLARIGRRRQ